MSGGLEVVLLNIHGPKNDFGLGDSIQCNLALSKKPKLSDLTSDDFQRLSKEGTGEYFVILESERLGNSAAIASALRRLQSKSELSCCLVPFQKNSEFALAWNRYPTRLASLVFAPEQHGALIFRRESLSEIDGFRDVRHPLWDAIIRLAAAGHDLTPVTSTSDYERIHPGQSPERIF
jgi:hypothetical protein